MKEALNMYNFAIAHFPSTCRSQVCEISVCDGYLRSGIFGIWNLWYFSLVALGAGSNDERSVPSFRYVRHVEVDWKQWESSELYVTKNPGINWQAEWLRCEAVNEALRSFSFSSSLRASLSTTTSEASLSLVRGDTRLVPAEARHTNREATRDATRVKINESL